MLQSFASPSFNLMAPEDGRMSVMDAIFARRAVRDFTPRIVSEASVHMLLYAAVQAPTAMHQEPWRFAVIQDRDMLAKLSDDAKHLLEEKAETTGATPREPDFAKKSDFNIFYNGGTLIAIFAASLVPFADVDCVLAAANVMLAACGMGLSTCPIGLAVEALNTDTWKETLNMPPKAVAVLPILVGYAAKATEVPSRKSPDVTFWKRTSRT